MCTAIRQKYVLVDTPYDDPIFYVFLYIMNPYCFKKYYHLFFS